MQSQETEWGAGFFVTNLLWRAAAVSFTCSKVLIRVGRLTLSKPGWLQEVRPHHTSSGARFLPRWEMFRQVAFQIPGLTHHCPLQIPLCLWDYFSLGYYPCRQGITVHRSQGNWQSRMWVSQNVSHLPWALHYPIASYLLPSDTSTSLGSCNNWHLPGFWFCTPSQGFWSHLSHSMRGGSHGQNLELTIWEDLHYLQLPIFPI